MAILKVDTISGIGTEGPVFEGDIEFTSQNFLTLPKGDTTQRGRGRGVLDYLVVDMVVIRIGFSDKYNEYFINIQSQGNAIDFGDLTTATRIYMLFASINSWCLCWWSIIHTNN